MSDPKETSVVGELLSIPGEAAGGLLDLFQEAIGGASSSDDGDDDDD